MPTAEPRDAAVVRPLIFTSLVALVVGVFWIAVTTYSAPTDFVTLPDNQLRTGALHLDLSDGSASADLSFSGLLPGDTHVQRWWLVANDPSSVVAGVLTVRLDDVRDVAGPCATSRGKALAEQASGVGGCRIGESTVSGTPTQGNLSRLLSLELRVDDVSDRDACSADRTPGDVVVPAGPGNVRSLAGRQLDLSQHGSDAGLLLAPGQGTCVTAELAWPPSVTKPADADSDHPLDNAAQGDGLQVRAVFTLSQVAP